MSGWSSGYVVDVEYTHGFYPELSPSQLGFFALLQGMDAPGLDLQPRTYCELGCGQGLSTNLLAAANPHIAFYATDFNPAHIAGAKALAQSAKSKNVHFSDDSFAEFLAREDLPDFDFITLHGIYSWISPENRQNIVRFIARKLKPGGIVYLSYNCMPGWAAMMPLRRLMVEYADLQGSSRPMLSRIPGALDFATKLGGLETRFFENNPKLASRLDSMKAKNHNYIAHEYFNRDLTPFYFMDVAQELAEAKLTWVGPANTLDTLDMVNLTKDQAQFLREIDNVALRQTVRDHILDQQFRRDIFIKGPQALPRSLLQERWLDTRFVLCRKASEVQRHIQGLRYKVESNTAINDGILATLEAGPRSLREIVTAPALAKVELNAVIQVMTFLVAQGACQPCLPEQDQAERKIRAQFFNEAIAERSRYEAKYAYFASGVTGSGFAADRISQLFWLALQRQEKDVPGFVWNVLKKAGHRLLKDGKTLTSEEENLAELIQRLAVFESLHTSTWKALGLNGSSSPAGSEEKRRAGA